MIIIGVDLATRATGLARIELRPPTTTETLAVGGIELRPAPTSTITTGRVETHPPRGTPTLRGRLIRMRKTLEVVLDWARGSDLVAIEDASQATARRQTGAFDQAGLWWITVEHLLNIGCEVIDIPTGKRCQYATGKTRTEKNRVMAAVIKRYADVDVPGDDEADALILAAMTARWAGYPIERSLPLTHLDAMGGVAWPERVST